MREAIPLLPNTPSWHRAVSNESGSCCTGHGDMSQVRYAMYNATQACYII